MEINTELLPHLEKYFTAKVIYAVTLKLLFPSIILFDFFFTLTSVHYKNNGNIKVVIVCGLFYIIVYMFKH